eukprot:CAMPEP_0174894366 /NCGR_PEP_ID=MMETSP0167-20121228/9012_1 /TAXON_ID=38298 /ORGANISM="Rhodella maculata, Strain CCMP736" /LENGTH=70 /DNA_ID=CAMNT_0016133429 /DNA_START=116 /DNA_END=328 /DNA_ORIENTATION=-
MAEEKEAALDAYGKLALKRVIDFMPMGCRTMFVEAPDMIREGLDGVKNEELAFLMQDSEAFRSKYRELEL